MIRESVTVDEAIALLNEALRLDPSAVAAILACRAVCNSELANHPTIQVGPESDGEPISVAMLGILNGMFGTDERGYGPITLLSFNEKPQRFMRTPAANARAIVQGGGQ